MNHSKGPRKGQRRRARHVHGGTTRIAQRSKHHRRALAKDYGRASRICNDPQQLLKHSQYIATAYRIPRTYLFCANLRVVAQNESSKSMATAVTPPNPSLVAILLVTQIRGRLPQIVFHYPPDPLNPVSLQSLMQNSWSLFNVFHFAVSNH